MPIYIHNRIVCKIYLRLHLLYIWSADGSYRYHGMLYCGVYRWSVNSLLYHKYHVMYGINERRCVSEMQTKHEMENPL